MRTVSLLTDLPPYADPWHGLPATSGRVQEILSGWGFAVDVTGSLERVLERRPELLVVNLAGRGAAEDPHLDEHAKRLGELAALGVPTLALHSSAIAFGGVSAWRELIGGGWIPGESRHPQIGNAVFEPMGAHPIVAGLPPFLAYDERYSFLGHEAATPLVSHVEDGVRHVLAWAVETSTGRRAVYDGLGHAVESYDSEGRLELLRREIEWLTSFR